MPPLYPMAVKERVTWVDTIVSLTGIGARFAQFERARLYYTSRDAYAGWVLFPDLLQDGEVPSWSFARELLHVGVDEPAGDGDVRVTPMPFGVPVGNGGVAIELSSPDGRAWFEGPRSAFLRFLQKTYLVVPRGRESEFDQDVTNFDERVPRRLY